MWSRRQSRGILPKINVEGIYSTLFLEKGLIEKTNQPGLTGPSRDHLSGHKLHSPNKDHTPAILLSYGSYAKRLPFSSKCQFYALCLHCYLCHRQEVPEGTQLKPPHAFLAIIQPSSVWCAELTSWIKMAEFLHMAYIVHRLTLLTTQVSD